MIKRRLLIVIGGFFLLFFIFQKPLLTSIGDFLIIVEPLQKTDVIVVLSGEPAGSRVPKGVELYKKEYAHKIIMIGSQIQWDTY